VQNPLVPGETVEQAAKTTVIWILARSVARQ
jgi:hypothetical protein